MTFDDYLDTGMLNIRFPRSRADEEKQIEDALRFAYDKSPTAKKMIDDWFNDGNDFIYINYKKDTYDSVTLIGSDGKQVGGGILNIDLNYHSEATYLTPDGKVVQQTVLTSVLHELGHALKGLNDNWEEDVGRYTGDNQRFINTICEELKTDQRISYQAFDPTGKILQKGADFTGGEKIDGALVGDKIDLSGLDKSKSVLVVGLNDESNIAMGAGDDFLAGQGGNDTMDGGAGTDTAVYFGKREDYDLEQNSDGSWTIKHVRNFAEGSKGEGTDTLKNIEKARFSDVTIDLPSRLITVEEIFIALFGRPVDPEGLNFFNDATDKGKDLNKIGDLSASEEYQSRFFNKSNAERIDTIYNDLFGRNAEPEGLNFFLGRLESGVQSLNTIAIDIISGALGTDRTIIDNKLAAAQKFFDALDTPAKIAAYAGLEAAVAARDFLAVVTKDTASIPSEAEAVEAVKQLLSLGNDTGSGGAVITLSIDTDQVSPNAMYEHLKSTDSADTITAPGGTFSDMTNINAGGGVDSFFGTFSEGGKIKPTLNNIEYIFLTAQGSGSGAEINLSNTHGEMQIWNKASTRDFFASEISSAAVLGVEGSVKTSAFTFKPEEVSEASDSATVVLKNVSSLDNLILVDIETVNLTIDGTSSFGGIVLANATTVNLAGNGDLTAAFSGPHAVFNASELAGKLNVSFANTVAGVTFTGTTRGDNVAFEASANALTDTIIYTNGNLSVLANRDVFTNFVSGANEDKINLSGLILEGAKTMITTFGVIPGEGTSFGGSAIGRSGSNTVYVDTNNDGVLNLTSDLAFDITGTVGTLAISDFIF